MTVESLSSSLERAARKIEELIENAKRSSEADLGKIRNRKFSL